MALLFVPVLGGIMGKPQYQNEESRQRMLALHEGDFEQARGITWLYYKTLAIAIKAPILVLISAIVFAGGVFYAYNKAELGAEFFPEVDPSYFTVKARSNGDLSIREKDAIMRQIETEIVGHPELESVYTKTGGRDEIGSIQITPVDWTLRRPIKEIIADLREDTAKFAGVELSLNSQMQVHR